MSDQRQYTCIHMRSLEVGSTAYAQPETQISYYGQPTNEFLTMIRMKGSKR